RVADMRALGCVLALDDVGGASDSLAMMAVLAPEVVRLDLADLAQRPEDDLAVVVDAVAAHAERAGATLLVQRVGTPEQATLAAPGSRRAGCSAPARRSSARPSPPRRTRSTPRSTRTRATRRRSRSSPRSARCGGRAGRSSPA